MLKNTVNTYGSIAKFFHWLMAILLICMFIVAYIMTNIPRSPLMFSLYDLHKATGMLIFGLLMLRLAWRFTNVQPELPAIVPMWQQYAAKANIFLLYVLMFIMPITGFLTSTLGGHDITFYHLFTITPFGNDKAASEFFAEAHEIISYVIIAAFTLHVSAAFYHHYYLKDNVLRRMWWGS